MRVQQLDNYPEHLAPEFDEGGGVKTPFEEWWARVHGAFPMVPEDAARHWLHQHWKHSPYSYLRSRNYTFSRLDWQMDQLVDIRSRWSDFNAPQSENLQHGQYLLTLDEYPTTTFMTEHRMPPARIIVLDNQDGHLTKEYSEADRDGVPAGYVLIEGHRRFNLCLALHAQGRLDRVPAWLMRRV